MIAKRNSIRFFMLVLLAAGQLGTVVHAAQHGVGQHEHQGMLCVYGTNSDDDPVAILPASTTPVVAVETEPCSIVSVDSTYLSLGYILPPATGPPLTS